MPKRKGPSKPRPRAPKKVMVGYCTGGTVDAEFTESLLALVTESPHEILVSYAYSGPLIARARNFLLTRFLASNKDYFLSVDTDIQFSPSHLDQLLDQDRDIVSGLYYGLDRNTWDTFPVALRKREDGSLPPITSESLEVGVQQVDAVGMGFVLIKRRVIELLGVDISAGFPFGEIALDGRMYGEDSTFCYRAKQAGFEVWLDPNTRVGHKKSIIL